MVGIRIPLKLKMLSFDNTSGVAAWEEEEEEEVLTWIASLIRKERGHHLECQKQFMKCETLLSSPLVSY